MQGNLSVEEMVINDSFINYCKQINEPDILKWEQYILSYPSQKENIEEARRIVLGLKEMLRQEITNDENFEIFQGKVIPMRIKKPLGKRIIQYAAACIILLLAAGTYFFVNQKQQEKVAKKSEQQDVKAPVSNKSTITLADGRTILLDSLNNGVLAEQGNVKVVKLANGQIAYQSATGEIITEIQYNTLSNPRGSQVINMTLSDGSNVWLNAGSSLTYPVVFAGEERTVSIIGEAYFEVAHDTKKPFRVKKEAMQVEVLGTHFNVNAYDDESDIKVTLLEGSIKVNKSSLSAILKPGQQAKVSNEIKVNSNVDIDAVMAWKNGLFHFDNASLQDVLKQLSRWYDVEIIYEEEVPSKKFVGEMERGLTLAQVIRILEKNEVHFKISGKKLIVRR